MLPHWGDREEWGPAPGARPREGPGTGSARPPVVTAIKACVPGSAPFSAPTRPRPQAQCAPAAGPRPPLGLLAPETPDPHPRSAGRESTSRHDTATRTSRLSRAPTQGTQRAPSNGRLATASLPPSGRRRHVTAGPQPPLQRRQIPLLQSFGATGGPAPPARAVSPQSHPRARSLRPQVPAATSESGPYWGFWHNQLRDPERFLTRFAVHPCI